MNLLEAVRARRRFLACRYFSSTVGHPRATLAVAALLVAALGAFAGRFELDASADALVLEEEQALAYYRSIRARYGSDDFLVVAYAPRAPLFVRPTLERIESLRDAIAAVDGVASVMSLLDVPLLQSPPIAFSDIEQGGHTLLSPQTDIELARKELTQSALYRNLLVSADGDTAGLYVDLERGERYRALRDQLNALRERRLEGDLEPAERNRLQSLARQLEQFDERVSEQRRRVVAAIRDIAVEYRDRAQVHLAGVPMIVVDMIRFIRHDLRVFGAAVFSFIVVLLAVWFRRPRWVVMPLLVCAGVALGMIGGLGLLAWPVTVVSSNFLPVLLIITLSLIVHLIVRHEELRAREPPLARTALIAQTVRDKFAPSFYTALTTLVAFGSLTVTAIRPVVDFGWIMVAGIILAFVLVFLVFPAYLAALPLARPVARRYDVAGSVTDFFAGLIERRRAATLALAALVFVLAVAGMPRLSVENRFIDYFDPSTEIHQGMVTLDRELGGTTPLDVIVDAPSEHREAAPAAEPADDLPVPLPGSEARPGLSGTSYWYNVFRLEEVKRMHDYLAGLPATGKVLSLATTIRVLEQLNRGQPLDNFTLSIVHERLPEEIERQLFDPYMSADGNQLRFAVRLYETSPALERDQLLRRIPTELVQRFDLARPQVHVTGLAVLYNDMLQTLLRSQVLSLGSVFVAIFLMFALLFRSIAAAAIAIVPNLLVAALVLGLMGWLGISLDMMTITIAAIAMGIAVDDTIHYTHRFMAEFGADRDYWATTRRCHGSVGRAVFYTSVTITLGFAILVLSDFVPTVHFGLLTGIAMVAALVADLAVLPALFATFKPFGRA